MCVSTNSNRDEVSRRILVRGGPGAGSAAPDPARPASNAIMSSSAHDDVPERMSDGQPGTDPDLLEHTKREPICRTPVVSPAPRCWPWVLPSRADAAPQEPPAATAASEMKPYVETIPGTDIKFEMVPIPGGTFVMGRPPSEAKRSEDEGPQHPVKIAPFWMGKYEVTWDEYDQFAFSLDLKKKKRDGVDPAEAAGRREEGRRGDPADAALRRRDLRLRPQGPAGDLHHPPRGDGILPLALGQDRQDLPPADRGRVGIRLPRRDQDRLLLRRRPRQDRRLRLVRRERREAAAGRQEEAQPLGPLRHARQRRRVVPRPLRRPTPTSSSPRDKPAVGPVVLPDAKEYPYVARGGSWDDDADRLRSAARQGLEPRVERPGPAAAPEHLVAHRRHLRRLPGRPAPRASRRTSRA